MGLVSTSITVGPLKLSVLTIALGMVLLGGLIAIGFWLAGSLGFGPLAPPIPPEVDRRAAPASPAPEGWLRLGSGFGVPAAWMAATLLVLPIVVYVISYLPWVALGNRLTEGWPPGNHGQTLLQLTQSMYDYHNNLRRGAPGLVAVVGLAARPQAGLVLPGLLRRQHGGVHLRRRQPRHLVACRTGHGVLRLAGVPAAQPRAGADRAGVCLAMAALGAHRPGDVPVPLLHERAVLHPRPVLLHGRALARRVAPHLAAGEGWPRLRPSSDRRCSGSARGRCAASFGSTPSTRARRPAPGTPATWSSRPRLAALVLIVGVAVVVMLYLLLHLDRGAAGEAGGGRAATSGTFGRLLVTVLVAAIGIVVAQRFVGQGVVFQIQGFDSSYLAVLLGIPLFLIALFILTARDARRFVAGAGFAAVVAFLIEYPNISALPLPSTIVNAYQGLLPTYLYPFQFPVNTDPAAPSLHLFSLEPAVLLVALTVTSLVVGYAAWVWRIGPPPRPAWSGGAWLARAWVGLSFGRAGSLPGGVVRSGNVRCYARTLDLAAGRRNRPSIGECKGASEARGLRY